MALDVHVVSHTHWDREWYHPFERFRQRLVALVDELLDDPPTGGASFLLDGQAVLIDDYRRASGPSALSELAALLRDGTLEAGPWYVLADELIPSGEALVRNLLAGRRTLARFGATSPPVLYCPDSFGHPAALPDIARGLRPAADHPVARLRRRALARRRHRALGRRSSGETRRALSSAARRLRVRLASPARRQRRGGALGAHARASSRPRSTTGVMLVPNGADHHARQRAGARRSARSSAPARATTCIAARSAQFAERLVERAAAQRLPLVRGELRDSYGYTWTLQGTFAHARAREADERARRARCSCAKRSRGARWRRVAARRAARSSRRRGAICSPRIRTTRCAAARSTTSRVAMEDACASATRAGARHSRRRHPRSDRPRPRRGARVAAIAGSRWSSCATPRRAARSGVALIDVEEFVAHVAVGPGSAPRGAPRRRRAGGKPQIRGARRAAGAVRGDALRAHRVAAPLSGQRSRRRAPRRGVGVGCAAVRRRRRSPSATGDARRRRAVAARRRRRATSLQQRAPPA